jgi:anti-sigma28 factor (negative regulator of flagellin synthesis)
MATKKSTKKSTAKKKTAKKATTRTYGPKASAKVKKTMEEMKAGKLRSGGSGKKVTDPKQAIAIGLSEARRSGAKGPERAE